MDISGSDRYRESKPVLPAVTAVFTGLSILNHFMVKVMKSLTYLLMTFNPNFGSGKGRELFERGLSMKK
jgi:hypothetical protein